MAAGKPSVAAVRYDPKYASYGSVELMDALVRTDDSVESLRQELEALRRSRCRERPCLHPNARLPPPEPYGNRPAGLGPRQNR